VTAEPVTVRAAQAADTEAIAEIWHQGYRDGHLGSVPAEIFGFRRLEDFLQRVPSLLDVTAVAVVGSDVVGFVMVEGDELNQLYVAEAARGSAVAVALLERGEAMIAELFDRGWLAVVAGNTRARRFYERGGWHEVRPIQQPSYAGEGEQMMIPALRYEKQLRP
jgi:ribosomal protein S18 acetylase RimI-like enzyme